MQANAQQGAVDRLRPNGGLILRVFVFLVAFRWWFFGVVFFFLFYILFSFFLFYFFHWFNRTCCKSEFFLVLTGHMSL